MLGFIVAIYVSDDKNFKEIYIPFFSEYFDWQQRDIDHTFYHIEDML